MTFLYEDNENPWLIERSEVDQLEEWYADLLVDSEEIGGRRQKIVSALVREQEEIERRARKNVAELDTLLDEDEADWEEEVSEEFSPHLPLREALRQSLSGSALYTESLGWARACARFAMEQDRFLDEPSEDLLRLMIHAMVVPPKIRFAEEEEASGEPLGDLFSGLEYQLAGDYLSVALSTLDRLSLTYEIALRYRARGASLLKKLEQVRMARGRGAYSRTSL